MAGYNLTRSVQDLLTRTDASPPSFTVNLHQDYWTLNNGPKFLYNNQVASLLDDIRAHRIPVDFLDLFDSAKVPFYDGCMLVELLDYRSPRSRDPALEKPERTRVVLHPNPETLWTDICLLNEKNSNKWTDNDALEIEARIVLATSGPLCLEPDPHLTRVANHILRVSTPTAPVSLKRKSSVLDPEEDETEKARKAKIMQYMNPRPNRSGAPSYRILDTLNRIRLTNYSAIQYQPPPPQSQPVSQPQQPLPNQPYPQSQLQPLPQQQQQLQQIQQQLQQVPHPQPTQPPPQTQSQLQPISVQNPPLQVAPQTAAPPTQSSPPPTLAVPQISAQTSAASASSPPNIDTDGPPKKKAKLANFKKNTADTTEPSQSTPVNGVERTPSASTPAPPAQQPFQQATNTQPQGQPQHSQALGSQALGSQAQQSAIQQAMFANVHAADGRRTASPSQQLQMQQIAAARATPQPQPMQQPQMNLVPNRNPTPAPRPASRQQQNIQQPQHPSQQPQTPMTNFQGQLPGAQFLQTPPPTRNMNGQVRAIAGQGRPNSPQTPAQARYQISQHQTNAAAQQLHAIQQRNLALQAHQNAQNQAAQQQHAQQAMAAIIQQQQQQNAANGRATPQQGHQPQHPGPSRSPLPGGSPLNANLPPPSRSPQSPNGGQGQMVAQQRMLGNQQFLTVPGQPGQQQQQMNAQMRMGASSTSPNLAHMNTNNPAQFAMVNAGGMNGQLMQQQQHPDPSQQQAGQGQPSPAQLKDQQFQAIMAYSNSMQRAGGMYMPPQGMMQAGRGMGGMNMAGMAMANAQGMVPGHPYYMQQAIHQANGAMGMGMGISMGRGIPGVVNGQMVPAAAAYQMQMHAAQQQQQQQQQQMGGMKGGQVQGGRMS